MPLSQQFFIIIKHFLIIVLTFLGFSNCFGQNFNSIDSTCSYRLETSLKELSLEDLTKTKFTKFLRIWTGGQQIIEVWQDGKGKIHGIVTSYVWTSNDSDIAFEEKVIFEKRELSTGQSKMIFNEADFIDTIPFQKDIIGWSDGVDGTTITIEFCSKKRHFRKCYWTPRVQNKSIVESVKLNNFLDNLKIRLNLKDLYKEFYDKLPIGEYKRGMMIYNKVK